MRVAGALLVWIPPLLLAAGCVAPRPVADPPRASEDVEPTTPDRPRTTESIAEPTSEPAVEPTTAPTAEPTTAYPAVHCGFADAVDGRWEIVIDPSTRADRRRAARLLEAYPDADGRRGRLARSNLPAALQHLNEVTLVAEHGTAPTRVRRIGVRPSPSEGRFVLVLEAKTSDPRGRFALVVEGSTAATWRTVAANGDDAKLAPSGAVDLLPWLRTELDRQGVERDASVRLVAVGRVDLDGDGLDEVVVHERWPEGLFVWLVRNDATRGGLVAQRICGDAA